MEKKINQLAKKFLEFITSDRLTQVLFFLIFLGFGYTISRVIIGLIFNI